MDKRIDEICDERDGGGDFFVYLRPGWALSSPPQHCFGAETRREIKQQMRAVYRCECAECQHLIALGDSGDDRTAACTNSVGA